MGFHVITHMADFVKIPMFPLSIFLLPGELVPLHIFEPRYRQLLEEAEKHHTSFGIFCNHSANTRQLGSLVKLETVMKRYSTGESDIIVRCVDLFEMSKLYRTFDDKLYPAGDVRFWRVSLTETVSTRLAEAFNDYCLHLNLKPIEPPITGYKIASELALDFSERLKFVLMEAEKKESFLLSRLRYQIQLQLYAEKAKDVFHLN